MARIPREGHPENKYFTDRKTAIRSRHVTQVARTNKYEVQYNASGRVEPPIIQPRKYEFLQQIALRLGRDITKSTQVVGQPLAQHDRNSLIESLLTAKGHADQRMADQPATPNPNNISLIEIARELNRMAPELAVDPPSTIDVANLLAESATTRLKEKKLQGANRLIHKQVVEELNNNWESRFPEKEPLWDYARPRLSTYEYVDVDGQTERVRYQIRNFFSMRRWPPQCQSYANKQIILASGPIVADAPPITAPTTVARTDAQIRANLLNRTPKARHIGGQPPNFPFGETPYQQAWLSYRMEQELKDGLFLLTTK